ncbi:MAG: triose-phosphate isomerase [Planctomycetota bacterium]|jgi:triosephosphate isomerase|nr:triose-phosphate isomerase [Planctomycetota bacterium]
MRTPFICGNWKMYKTVSEALAFLDAAKGLVAGAAGVEVGIGAPATALKSLADAARGSNIRIGGENCHWEKEGAFTGEISVPMLVEAGCAFVIVGHSERRQYFGETNETVNRKVKAALAGGLAVIMCCGETLGEREAGRTGAVVTDHVKNGLAGLTPAEMTKVVVAYEPVWAIGTGRTATPGQAQEAHAVIRELLAGMFGDQTAEATRIQYGGSVKPENVEEIMAQPDVDGALVGGASLKPDSFAKLVNFRA